MKKTVAIITVCLLTFSMISCSNRNLTGRRQNNGINQGTSQGTGQGRTNQDPLAAGLRDGIYTGQGNMSATGNQTATIYVRNGRIVDVLLDTAALKGSTSTADSGETTAIGSKDASKTAVNGNGITSNTGAANSAQSSPNRINGGNPPGGANTGVIHDASAHGVTSGGSDLDTNPLNISQVKRNLENSVVQYQTYDVSIGTNNPAMVENWKLAIRRAIDKARI